MFKQLFKNPIAVKIAQGLFIAVGAFVLANLTFMVFALVINGLDMFILPKNFIQDNQWFIPVTMSVIAIAFLIGYYFIYRSKIKDFYKATLATVPAEIVLTATGILLYRWPVVAFGTASVLTAGTFYYFWKTKKPWHYYFAVGFVAGALLIMNLTGQDI